MNLDRAKNIRIRPANQDRLIFLAWARLCPINKPILIATIPMIREREIKASKR